MTRKDQIIEVLRQKKGELAATCHVSGMALFGSFARGEAKPGSDIDILADFDSDAGLFDLSRAQLTLSDALGAQVDLVPRNALRPELRDRVLADCIAI